MMRAELLWLGVVRDRGGGSEGLCRGVRAVRGIVGAVATSQGERRPDGSTGAGAGWRPSPEAACVLGHVAGNGRPRRPSVARCTEAAGRDDGPILRTHPHPGLDERRG